MQVNIFEKVETDTSTKPSIPQPLMEEEEVVMIDGYYINNKNGSTSFFDTKPNGGNYASCKMDIEDMVKKTIPMDPLLKEFAHGKEKSFNFIARLFSRNKKYPPNVTFDRYYLRGELRILRSDRIDMVNLLHIFCDNK